MLGTVVKMLFGMPKVPALSLSPASCEHTPSEILVIAQVVGSLSLTWETWIEFPALGRGLAQSQLLVSIWKGNLRLSLTFTLLILILLLLGFLLDFIH